jgi:hypothetical protein
MSSADLPSVSLVRGSDAAVARPKSRGRVLRRIARFIGGFILTGIFFVLSVPVFVLCAFYGFVWFAQHQ